MDVLVFRALALLGLAILVALAARRLRLPYTVGLVLAGGAGLAGASLGGTISTIIASGAMGCTALALI